MENPLINERPRGTPFLRNPPFLRYRHVFFVKSVILLVMKDNKVEKVVGINWSCGTWWSQEQNNFQLESHFQIQHGLRSLEQVKFPSQARLGSEEMGRSEGPKRCLVSLSARCGAQIPKSNWDSFTLVSCSLREDDGPNSKSGLPSTIDRRNQTSQTGLTKPKY